jgi:hypothetical protein
MRKLFIVLLFGMAASAAIGGFDLAFNSAKWMKLPLEFMTGFSSFVIPGLLLLFVVGGTNLIAGIAVAKRSKWAVELSATAGFGLMIWFFTELYLFRDTNPIQIVYFGWGVAILILAFLAQKYGFATKQN